MTQEPHKDGVHSKGLYLVLDGLNLQISVKAETNELNTSSPLENVNDATSDQVDIKKVCHACLCTSTTLYPVPDYLNFIEMANEGLLSYLCSICTVLYCKCVQFKTSAHEARSWLTKAWSDDTLTQEELIIKQKQLSRPLELSEKHYPPNCYNYVYNIENDSKSISKVLENDSKSKSKALENLSKSKSKVLENLSKSKSKVLENLSKSKSKVLENLSKSKSKALENDSNLIENYSQSISPLTPDGTEYLIISSDNDINLILIDETQEPNDMEETIVINESDATLPPNCVEDNEGMTKELSENYDEIDDFFDIKILSMQEQKDELANRKHSRLYQSSKWKCHICYKGYNNEKTFAIHMSKHEPKKGTKLCTICHQYIKMTMNQHLDRSHRFLMTCKKCSNFKTKLKESARRHVDWHNNKRFNCEKCNKEFKTESSYLSHARIKHPSKFVCSLCGCTFLGEHGLAIHYKRIHALDDLTIPEDGPVCTEAECNIKFANQDALKTHMRVSHNYKWSVSRPMYVRPPCRRERKAPVVQVLDPPVPCEQCGLPMHTRRQYCLHFTRNHPENENTKFPPAKHKYYLCQKCGSAFYCQKELDDHDRVVHKGNLYICDACGGQFKRKITLSNHYKAVHLGVTYACPTCGREFNSLTNRDRHYKYTHSDKRSMKCDFCDKLFKHFGDRKNHMDHVHLNKPWPRKDQQGKRKRKTDMTAVNEKRRKNHSESVDASMALQSLYNLE